MLDVMVNQRHNIKNDLPQMVDMEICFNKLVHRLSLVIKDKLIVITVIVYVT